jgi:hypothetical protein
VCTGEGETEWEEYGKLFREPEKESEYKSEKEGTGQILTGSFYRVH